MEAKVKKKKKLPHLFAAHFVDGVAETGQDLIVVEAFVKGGEDAVPRAVLQDHSLDFAVFSDNGQEGILRDLRLEGFQLAQHAQHKVVLQRLAAEMGNQVGRVELSGGKGRQR